MKDAVVPASASTGVRGTSMVLVSSILVQVAVVVEGFVCLSVTPEAVRRHDFVVGGSGSGGGGGGFSTSVAGSRLDHSSGSRRRVRARAFSRVRVQAGWCGAVSGAVLRGRDGESGLRLQAETSAGASGAAAGAAAAPAPRRRRPSAEGAAVTLNGKQGELRKLQDKLKRES